MGRVWTLAGAVALGCILIYLLVGFMGVVTLKFSSAIVGAGATAAYLPGGGKMSRGMFLLLGVVYGSLSFLLGALAFPDTNVGLVLGAIVPIIFSALTAMRSRSPETLLVMLLGAGSMGALFTTDFFADPQSLNFTLPIAIGQVMIAISIGYFLGVVAKAFGPKAPVEATTATATPDSSGWVAFPSSGTTDGATDATTALPAFTDETSEVAR